MTQPTPPPTPRPTGRSRHRSRTTATVAAITVAAAVALTGVAACGSSQPAGTATSPGSTPSTASPTSGGSTPPGPTGTPGPSGTADAAAPYPSAITDQVVANPAFAPLGKDITRRITSAGLPGASLLVLQDGKLVEQQAFGGYTLDTVVPIASASKWMSGAAIMSLVDDGLIDLDVPIRTYLPEATGPSGDITMRQLMSFTSGLEYDERIPCYNDLSKTLAQCNSEILQLPLLGKPGTGYRYTGTHLHVAAGVAEAVTGQTFEQIFQERIAQPLGMTHTSYVVRVVPASAPDGHPTPAGSATSTVGDYGRFLEMLVHDGVAPDGTRILSSDAITQMSTVQTADAKFVSAASYRKKDQTPYGLAHWIDKAAPDGHALVESSPGAFGFRPWIDSVNHVAGVYLVVDKDDSHIEDSPDRQAGGGADVQTSGQFVLEDTVKALKGQPLGLRG